MAFRGVGKSWITSTYVVWRLYQDLEYKALVVSASKSRSDDFTTFTKRIIKDVPFLQYLQPTDGQRDSMLAFDVAGCRPAHAPSVKSVGIFGQLAGSRAVEIIADDIEVPNNSTTQDMRDKLLKAVLEFEAIIMPEVGRITFLGTPQTEESLYIKMRERGYDIRIWTSEYPDDNKIIKYDGMLAPLITDTIKSGAGQAGQPTDPLRFNAKDLYERKLSYGRSGYALQFMLDTSLSDAERYPLKLKDLVVMPLAVDRAPVSLAWGTSPESQIKDLPAIGFSGDRWYRPIFIDEKWSQYEGSVMSIDPSGKGSDETGYAVVNSLHGKLFVTACGGLSGGYSDETLLSLAQIAKNNKVNKIIIEENFGGGMFAQLFGSVLQRVYPCTIEEVRHSTQKEKRIIDTLEPVMNAHRLVFDINAIRDDLKVIETNQMYSTFYQLTRITKDRGALKHDDRLDALAIAVNYWVETLGVDEKTAQDDFKERKLDEELQIFMDHVLGIDPSNRCLNWTDIR